MEAFDKEGGMTRPKPPPQSRVLIENSTGARPPVQRYKRAPIISPRKTMTAPNAIREHRWRPQLMSLYRWQNPMASLLATTAITLFCLYALPYLLCLRFFAFASAITLMVSGVAVRINPTRTRMELTTNRDRIDAFAKQSNIKEVLPACAKWAWDGLLEIDDPTQATLDETSATADTVMREANAAGTLIEELEYRERLGLIKKLGFIILVMLIVIQPALEWATYDAPSPFCEMCFLWGVFMMTRYPTRMLIRKLYRGNIPTEGSPTLSTTSNTVPEDATLMSTVSTSMRNLLLSERSDDEGDSFICSPDTNIPSGANELTLRWIVGDLLVVLSLGVVVAMRKLFTEKLNK